MESKQYFCVFELQQQFSFGYAPSVSIHSEAFGIISRELPAAGPYSKKTSK